MLSAYIYDLGNLVFHIMEQNDICLYWFRFNIYWNNFYKNSPGCGGLFSFYELKVTKVGHGHIGHCRECLSLSCDCPVRWN